MQTRFYNTQLRNHLRRSRLLKKIVILLTTILMSAAVVLSHIVIVQAQSTDSHLFTSKTISSASISASSNPFQTSFRSATTESSTPHSLRSDIQVRNIINTISSDNPSVRLVKDTRDNTLYYLKINGEIYQVNLANSTSNLVYTPEQNSFTNAQGLAIGADGTVYLVGNTDIENNQTRATILQGKFNSSTDNRLWSVLAQSEPYPRSNTAFDHRFNGIVVSPNGESLYINSGSRTDHGEVQSAGGSFPDTREVGLTACILRIPINSRNLVLPNDRHALKAAGYIFAEGTRNTFDFAFAPKGDLFGTENGPDRDMSDELNWLRPGLNYGFPWRIGGADNPQQFPDYNPANDLLLNPSFTAVQNGFFYNDPSFPPRPEVELTEPVINLGPDADRFRDLADGQVKDASDLGQALSTFTTHRSPLGLVFDTAQALSSEFQGDGFMLSFTNGDETGDYIRSPLNDPTQDLLHLDLNKVNDTSYELHATRIVAGFNNPIDAEIISNKIYVMEYGGNQGIWEVTMPIGSTTATVVVYEDENSAGETKLLHQLRSKPIEAISSLKQTFSDAGKV